MNPVLEFKSVTIRYDGQSTDTVNDVSFHVHSDERVALFGLNGSGKTSLLLAAVGLVAFTGAIFIDGTPVVKKTIQQARDKTGFLFNIPEDQILFPRVLDDVSHGLLCRGVSVQSAKKEALQMLSMLGMAHCADNSPFQLSHGQRQRVALAGALVTNPKVVLLDEPSSALDPRGKRSLTQTLRSIQSSIVIATHDIEFAAHTCNRYMVLHGKQLRECHSCEEAEEILMNDAFDELPGALLH